MIRRIVFITLLISFTLRSNAQRKHHLNEFITKHQMNGLVKSEKLIGYYGDKKKIYPKPVFVADSTAENIEWLDDIGEEVNGYYKTDSSRFTYNTLAIFDQFEHTQTWDKEKRLTKDKSFKMERYWGIEEYLEPSYIPGTYKESQYTYSNNYLYKKTTTFFHNLYFETDFPDTLSETIDSNFHFEEIAYNIPFAKLKHWENAENIYFFKDSLLQMAFSKNYYCENGSCSAVSIYEYNEQNKLINIKYQELQYDSIKPVIDFTKFVTDEWFQRKKKKLTEKKEGLKPNEKEVKLDEYGNWVCKKSQTFSGYYWDKHKFTFERTLEYYK